MPVKEEDRDDGEGSSRKRISRLKEGGAREAGFVHRGSGRESHSSRKRSAKGRNVQEPRCNNRLVKIELDAAEVLADLSRLTHLPSLKRPGDLKWSAKRKRTTRSYEASGLEMEPEDTHIQRSDLDSTTHLFHGDKASPLLDCRAESPSSPLPPSRLACRAFLVASNSAFQRVAPTEAMQKPGLITIKAEMEELQFDGMFSRPPASQKLRTLKLPLALCSVKAEPLDERVPLVELSHKAGLAVVNKLKATLSEEDKEARRLRRIQANRESARQTIRRKQILCEELTRQAATLASENEGMKQKREMLMQEFYFLKGQNYHLKTQLEMGSSGNLGPGTVQQSHRMPSQQLVSLPAWQGTNLPCTGFPSHLFGWPSMMVPAQTVHCPESLSKKESLEQYSRRLADYQSMEFQSTALIVLGIPVSSPVSVTGVSEQKCSHHYVCSPLPTSSPQEERSSSGGAGIETLKSTGASCSVDSASSDAQPCLEKEVGINSQTTLANENAMQARDSLCRPTAVVPFRGDCGVGDKHSTSRASECMECRMDLQVALPVTCGSSCGGSLGSMPMNGPGVGGLYGWRVTYAAATAAARKRRKELTRRKRFFSKASKLTRQPRLEKGEGNSLEGNASFQRHQS